MMKKLTRVQTSKLIGGASVARCKRMIGRYVRHGGSKLLNRILDNC